uniref:Complex III subunit 9 n=1 Tax=Peromyscus maniculatus bairdii TaxID=230844 RepID=A0A8C8UFW7_PERMB
MGALSLTSKIFTNSTFALTIIVGTLFFECAFNQGADAIYNNLNKGKLWKHIKHKCENKE